MQGILNIFPRLLTKLYQKFVITKRVWITFQRLNEEGLELIDIYYIIIFACCQQKFHKEAA